MLNKEINTEMRTFKIYRSILLNEGEKIDTENIGVSWTLCEIFAEDHANDINNFHGKDGFVILEAEVNEDSINWNNTLFAMHHREHEFEVVLNGGELTCMIDYTSGIDSYEIDDEIIGRIGGNDFEDYCDNYEGELTKEDFIKLASEF